jgi:hypothetical protein
MSSSGINYNYATKNYDDICVDSAFFHWAPLFRRDVLDFDQGMWSHFLKSCYIYFEYIEKYIFYDNIRWCYSLPIIPEDFMKIIASFDGREKKIF